MEIIWDEVMGGDLFILKECLVLSEYKNFGVNLFWTERQLVYICYIRGVELFKMQSYFRLT